MRNIKELNRVTIGIVGGIMMGFSIGLLLKPDTDRAFAEGYYAGITLTLPIFETLKNEEYKKWHYKRTLKVNSYDGDDENMVERIGYGFHLKGYKGELFDEELKKQRRKLNDSD